MTLRDLARQALAGMLLGVGLLIAFAALLHLIVGDLSAAAVSGLAAFGAWAFATRLLE